jgi:hypothetical protein
MLRLVGALAVSTLLVLNCGGDDEGDKTPIQDTKETDNFQDVPSGDNGYVSELPDLTGRSYRVSMLKGVSPTDIVNPTWEEDIASFDLVILFYVLSHDITNGDAVIHVTSCFTEFQMDGDERAKDGDGNLIPVSHQFALEPAVISTRFVGKSFRIDDPISLNIVTRTVSKPFHIFGVTGRGDFNEDGSRLTECWLEGAIRESETMDLCLAIPNMGSVNFHWFMNLASICPDRDTDADEKMDSYFFKGYLGARQIADGLFKEGIVEIVSLIDTCDPHTDTCVSAK